jgi:peptide/nickel transport system permease protein
MTDGVQKTTQAAEVWRRLKRNKAAIGGGVIVLLFVAVAIMAPVIAPHPPNEGDLYQRLKPPSMGHWLGTDALGRDILSRIIYGAQVSLQIQVVAVLIALVLGTLLGMFGGYYGG